MLLFLAIQFGRFAILQPGKTKLAVFSQICKPGTVVKYIHPLFCISSVENSSINFIFSGKITSINAMFTDQYILIIIF